MFLYFGDSWNQEKGLSSRNTCERESAALREMPNDGDIGEKMRKNRAMQAVSYIQENCAVKWRSSCIFLK
jgi:hypothetical protein